MTYQWNTFFVPIQSLYLLTMLDSGWIIDIGVLLDLFIWLMCVSWNESHCYGIYNQSTRDGSFIGVLNHCLPTSYEQGFSNDSLTPISGILVISLFSKDNTATFTGWYVMWHVLVILHCNDMVTLALYLDWLPATTICSWVDHLLYHCYGFYFEDW